LKADPSGGEKAFSQWGIPALARHHGNVDLADDLRRAPSSPSLGTIRERC
jgi:hypothetical protein